MKRLRLRFAGTVQGVGFRATARAIAIESRVTGWVRNEADGCVLLEVQGEGDDIQQFLDALRRRMGRLIRSETAEAIPATAADSGFAIRY